MDSYALSWTINSATLSGPAFVRFHTELAKYNARQLKPRFPEKAWREEINDYAQVSRAEGEYIEAARSEISPLLESVPCDVDGIH